MKTVSNIEAYLSLANAIVEKGVEDLAKATADLSVDPHNNQANCLKVECEKFFRNQWYGELTSLSADLCIKAAKIKAEEYKPDAERRYIARLKRTIKKEFMTLMNPTCDKEEKHRARMELISAGRKLEKIRALKEEERECIKLSMIMEM